MSGRAKNNPLIEANAQLQAEFVRLRDLCWIGQGKQLPNLGEVIVGYKTVDDESYGWCYRPSEIPCFTIAIDWDICHDDPSERLKTLLEEMTHLWMRRKKDKGNGGHGKRFKREFRRVTSLVVAENITLE